MAHVERLLADALWKISMLLQDHLLELLFVLLQKGCAKVGELLLCPAAKADEVTEQRRHEGGARLIRVQSACRHGLPVGMHLGMGVGMDFARRVIGREAEGGACQSLSSM